jgi:hypothetical protein
MSAAPLHPARPPPGSPGVLPVTRRFIVPPVPRGSRSSSSPLRGCGRSTWTRSSPAAACNPPTNRQERRTGLPLDPGPRLHRETVSRDPASLGAPGAHLRPTSRRRPFDLRSNSPHLTTRQRFNEHNYLQAGVSAAHMLINDQHVYTTLYLPVRPENIDTDRSRSLTRSPRKICANDQVNTKQDRLPGVFSTRYGAGERRPIWHGMTVWSCGTSALG